MRRGNSAFETAMVHLLVPVTVYRKLTWRRPNTQEKSPGRDFLYTYALTLADNGIGLPAGFDWSKFRTLGLILVRMLGQHQLGGQYAIDQEEGSSLTLTFTNR